MNKRLLIAIFLFILLLENIHNTAPLFQHYLYAKHQGSSYQSDFWDKFKERFAPEPIKWSIVVLSILFFLVFLGATLIIKKDTDFSRLFWISLISIITLVIVIPTLGSCIMRSRLFSFMLAHDGGVIQTELAIYYLLDGKNPYSEDYTKTPMAMSLDSNPDIWRNYGYYSNPALLHFPYLPATIYISIPFYFSFQALLGFYDQRFVYLFFLGLGCLFVYRSARSDLKRRLGVMLFALNPWLAGFITEGRNDILAVSILFIAFYFASINKWLPSVCLFAIALGIKQYCWLMLPFYAIFSLQLFPSLSIAKILSRLQARIVPIIIGLFILVIIYLPFVVWDPGALWDDIYSFNASGGADSYPIKPDRAYNLGSLLVNWGLLSPKDSATILKILQIIFCVPLLILLISRQLKDNRISNMLFYCGLFILTFGFFSRFLSNNMIGVVLALTVQGWVMMGDETSHEKQ